jgi:hypothetical protein
MTRLAWTFLRSAGWPRAALLAGATALATALLLVALTMLLLPTWPAEVLSPLITDPGMRWGTVFAPALLVVPLLMMLNQVVRLGTATRERRLAGLRLAGATPAEVRRIGAVEVGFPVTVGAIAGPVVFALLRGLFGGQRLAGPGGNYYIVKGFPPGYIDTGFPPALIPTSVTPAWWQIGAVVAVVAAAGIATGAMASRHLVASPLGVSRRAQPPPPRASWGLILLGTGAGAAPVAMSVAYDHQTPVVVAGSLLVVLGLIALGPWVAFRSGQRAAGRTSDPATLIAAGHLVSDPRPAGRAAAAVGAIGVVSGTAAVVELGGEFVGVSGPFGNRFALISFALVGVAIILVLLVTASTLAVHAAESVLDRRRVLAALVAAGTPVAVLRDSLRREAMLTSMPLSVGGVLLGIVVTAGLRPMSGRPITPVEGLALVVLVLSVCAQLIVTVGLTWVAIRIAIRGVEHRLVLATSPDNLRTG